MGGAMSREGPSSNPESWVEQREFVRALARRLLADEHAAEDVAQEACIAAFESPPRPGTPLWPWLAQVVRNLSSNRLRERERRVARERSVARTEGTDDTIDARIETQKRVLAAVGALREPYKSAIWMRWFEGLPPREIARRTAVPLETVKSRLKRGLQELERALDRDFGGDAEWRRALFPLALAERASVGTTGTLVAGTILCALAATWLVSRNPHEPGPASSAPAIGLLPAHAASTPAGADPTSPPRERLAVSEPRASPTADMPRNGAPSAGPSSAAEPTGPLFELELDPPPGLRVDDLTATLELDGQVPPAAERQTAAVRAGPAPHVRFDHAPRTSLLGGGARSTCTLTLASRDGSWAGSTRVQAPNETTVARARVALEARAGLAGRVQSSDGNPIGHARVRITGPDGVLECESIATDDGAWAATGLAPGRWTVRARSAAHGETSVELELDALERREETLVLPAAPTVSLTGRLASRSGAHVPRGPVRIVASDDPTFVVEVFPVPDPDRSGAWSFRCEALAPGTYVVIPPMEDAFTWSPPLLDATVPCRELAFTCLDGVPSGDIVLRAVEDESGHPIERFTATLLLDRRALGRRAALAFEPGARRASSEHGEARFTGLPRDARGWWLVEAEGRASSWGELTALCEMGNARLETVRLARAWRASFWIGTRDESGRPIGLEHAQVRTRGGTLLTQSLAGGEALLDLLFDPGRLEVVLPGWRVARMEGFRNGKRVEPLELHRVWLVRD